MVLYNNTIENAANAGISFEMQDGVTISYAELMVIQLNTTEDGTTYGIGFQYDMPSVLVYDNTFGYVTDEYLLPSGSSSPNDLVDWLDNSA